MSRIVDLSLSSRTLFSRFQYSRDYGEGFSSIYRRGP